MPDTPAPLLVHLESHLGPMAGGHRFATCPDKAVDIARFEAQPVPNAITYVTTGLSRHTLHQLSGRPIRLEILACVWARFRASGMPSLLHALAQDILEKHHAPARGQVVGPAGPVVSGSTLEAFTFIQPLYHAEALEQVGSDEPPLLIVWVLPVSASEAAFIRANGPQPFESLIHEANPDLLDLGRSSIV